MTLLPSVNYVTHSGDRIGKITYLKRDPDFDGMIFFHNSDGTFAGGWRYENGNYLKPDYLEGAKAIEIARTLLHEGLHALK